MLFTDVVDFTGQVNSFALTTRLRLYYQDSVSLPILPQFRHVFGVQISLRVEVETLRELRPHFVQILCKRILASKT